MQESKIVQALDEFKAKYSWDKSLNKTSQPSSLVAPPCLINSSIDDFVSLHATSENE